MKFKKNILLIFSFFIFSFIIKGEEKTNDIDYVGFYATKENYYARVGKYDDEELEYNDIKEYNLILGNEKYPVLLEENNKIDLSLSEEFIYFSTDEKGILESLVSSFYSSENNALYFLRGEFYKKLFIGEVKVMFEENLIEGVQTYSVFLFSGIFYVTSLVSGIDQEYKNFPIKLKRIRGITYELDKYKCVIEGENAKIYNKKSYKLRDSKTPDEKNLEKIMLEYKYK